ncbi:MAG: response regulator [Limisphaerales bacterium]
MKKILIVEDDAIVASIYRNKLQNEGYDVEIVADGERAIAQLKSAPPDLILLDLGLPKINGVDVLKAIRSNPATASVGVIVLSNSYVTSLVQAAWKAGANKCLSKADTTPRLLVDIIHGMFVAAAARAAASANAEREATSPSAIAGGVKGTAPSVALPTSSDALFQSSVRLALLGNAPGFIEDLRKRLKILGHQSGDIQSPADLFDFYRAVHSLTGYAGSAGFRSVAHLCAALEALLKELHDKPKKIGPSPIRTVAQAIDSLARLFDQERLPHADEQAPPLILVVDDDLIARRTLCSALDKAHLRSISVDDPAVAFRLLEENACDLIFSDVEMPAMNGFDFCAKVRGLPQHKCTPLVFVTSLADFENRARSVLSGGTDLIAKPFLLVELAVKALTCVLRKPSSPERRFGPST